MRSMADDKIRKQQGERLAQARARAGWRSARSAALDNQWAESTYRAHENGSRTIGQDDAETYARRFKAAGVDVTAQGILFGFEGPIAAEAQEGNSPSPGGYVEEPNAILEGPAIQRWTPPVRDIEELGVGVASIDDDDSAFEFNGQVVDRVVRPPGLLNRPGVFALRVANLSMWPRFRDGERVYVDLKKPAIEDFVVVELKPTEEGRPGKAFVKMLVARDARKVVVEQFNPPGRLEFGNQEILRIFRVIPTEELWG